MGSAGIPLAGTSALDAGLVLSRWLLGGATLLFVCAPGAPGLAADDCAPWPGEMSPLPSVDSDDAFAAEWAELRSRELATVAQALEGERPAASYRIWAHVRCLDPGHERAGAWLESLRPQIRNQARRFALRPKPPVSSRKPMDLDEVDALIGDARSALVEARFERALELADAARRELRDLFSSSDVRERRARLEVTSATAYIALGREDDARASFDRALDADPSLDLDDRTISPKVRRMFAKALAERVSRERR